MFDLSKYYWKSMLTWHFLRSVKLQSPLHASAECDRRKTVPTGPSVGTAGEIWARLVINLKYNTVNRMLMIDLWSTSCVDGRWGANIGNRAGFWASLLHVNRLLTCPKLGVERHLEAEEIRRSSEDFRPRRSLKLHALCFSFAFGVASMQSGINRPKTPQNHSRQQRKTKLSELHLSDCHLADFGDEMLRFAEFMKNFSGSLASCRGRPLQITNNVRVRSPGRIRVRISDLWRSFGANPFWDQWSIKSTLDKDLPGHWSAWSEDGLLEHWSNAFLWVMDSKIIILP